MTESDRSNIRMKAVYAQCMAAARENKCSTNEAIIAFGFATYCLMNEVVRSDTHEASWAHLRGVFESMLTDAQKEKEAAN